MTITDSFSVVIYFKDPCKKSEKVILYLKAILKAALDKKGDMKILSVTVRVLMKKICENLVFPG